MKRWRNRTLCMPECFDGDAPELSAHKLKTAPDFQAGLEHFFARNFPEAGVSFGKVLKSNPGDQKPLPLHRNFSYFWFVSLLKCCSMIRTILKAEKRILEISLPPEYVGKKIEIIAFLLEEAYLLIAPQPTGKTFSAIELDTRGFNFNREEANER